MIFAVIFYATLILFPAYAAIDAPAPSIFYARKAQRALGKEQFDSAFNYYALAHVNGMPKDSLLLGWADVYLAKGVYDTALALNFSIGKNVSPGFKYMVFRQRYLIYSALTWTAKAQEMLDSIRSAGGNRKTGLIPDISIYSAVGYMSNRDAVSSVFPWSELGILDTTDIENGLYAKQKTSFLWDIVRNKKPGFAFGLGYSVDKPYYVADNIIDSIKLNMLVTGSFAVKRIFEKLNVQARLSARRNYLDEYSALSQIEMSYLYTGSRFSSISMAGYEIEVTEGTKIENQNVWGMTALGLSSSQGNGFTFSFLANGYITDQLSFSYSDLARVIYVEDVTADFVTHYTDASFSQKIDTIGKTVLDYSREVNDVAFGLVPIDRLYEKEIQSRISHSHVFLAPMASYAHKLGTFVKMTAGLGWTGRWYNRKYSWINLSEEQLRFITNYNTRLAYNRSDGRYYALIDRIQPDYPVFPQPLSHDYSLLSENYVDTPVVFHSDIQSHRRIDNSVNANVSYEFLPKYIGSLTATGYFSYTWTTLPDNCPVEVPNLNWTIQVTWRKDISPRSSLLKKYGR